MALSRDQADRIRRLGHTFDEEVLAATRALFTAAGPKVRPPDMADQPFGPHERQRLDVYLPAARPGPVVVYVPGGGFTGGNKDDGATFYRNVGTFFADRGFVCVIPNYRLAPAHPWPSGGEDVRAVLGWCRAHVAGEGGDSSRIHLVAQSAGATHAATALFHLGLADDGDLVSAVLINGLHDARLAPSAANFDGYFGRSAEERWAHSPLRGARRASLPILLVLAEYDPPLFAQAGYRLADALTEANGRSPAFRWLPGHNHVSCVFAIGSSADDLGPSIVDFIEAAEAEREGTRT